MPTAAHVCARVFPSRDDEASRLVPSPQIHLRKKLCSVVYCYREEYGPPHRTRPRQTSVVPSASFKIKENVKKSASIPCSSHLWGILSIAEGLLFFLFGAFSVFPS